MSRRTLLVLVLLASGCLWRSYEKILSVHVEVLTAVAGKMVGLAEAGRRPSSNDVTEMMYPLQRGKQFLKQNSGNAPRQSLQLFRKYLELYEAVAVDMDAARGDQGRWQELTSRLAGRRAELERLAGEIKAALGRKD